MTYTGSVKMVVKMVARKDGGHCNVTCENVVAWLTILRCEGFIFYLFC